MSNSNLPLYITVALSSASLLLTNSSFAEDKRIEEVEIIGKNNHQGLGLSTPSSTASRLGLSVKDTPASISIIDKEDIALRGDYSAIEATTRATGFSVSASPGNGGTGSMVRGFGGHGSVMTMYDSQRLFVAAGTISFPQDTWTIDRIEVLRGPGSVTHGIGAIGATINYIPKKPEFKEIENEVSISLGTNDLRRYAFGSGGQIDERSAYRFDIVDHQNKTDIKGNKLERVALSNSYLVKAHDDVDLLFSLDYAKTDETGTYYGTPLVNGKVKSSMRKNNYNASNAYVKYEDIAPRIQVNWRMSDAVQWRSKLNYLDTDRQWSNIEGFTYDPATDQVNLSGELYIRHAIQQLGTQHDFLIDLDFSDTISNRLDVGFEVNRVTLQYDDSWADSALPSGTTLPSGVDARHPEPYAWKATKLRDYETTSMQYAAFLDNVIDFNHTVQIVTGIRRDKLDFDRTTKANTNRSQSKYSGAIYTTSWRAGLVYKPIESISLYTQYSKAVDAHGSLITQSPTNLKQEPMEGKQVEVGIKQQLLNDTLQYTFAVFSITKKNIPSKDPLDTTRDMQIGEQRSRGAEFSAFWVPVSVLRFDFNTAYTRAEYREFRDANNNYKGKRPSGIPKYTANLWATWNMTDPVALTLGARSVGSRYYTNENTAKLPSYVVYDASFTWNVNKQLRLGVRGKNLSNEKNYILSGNQRSWRLADGRGGEVNLHYAF